MSPSLRALSPVTLIPATLVVALLAAIVLAPRPAGAQQPPVVGDVPSEGVAFLVVGVDATPTNLAVSLADLGCAATTIGVTQAGTWSLYVPGAPEFVNAAFPGSLVAGTPFAVRCTPSAAALAFDLLEATGTGSGGPPPAGLAMLVDARTGGHTGFDRFVVEFAEGVIPGYDIRYVTTPQFTCGAGFEVTPPGNAWLSVKLEPARINDDLGQLSIPSRTLDPNLPALIAAEEICGFEGQVIWLLGLDEQQPFQLTLLADPARLVIDIPHAAPAAASGASGIALAGPQCPVEIQGQPCPDEPVDVTLAFSQGTTTVATVQTASDGAFSVDLPAGTYNVTTTGPQLPSLGPTQVTVPSGAHAWLELHLDTGIR
jgi:hypothetical protein